MLRVEFPANDRAEHEREQDGHLGPSSRRVRRSASFQDRYQSLQGRLDNDRRDQEGRRRRAAAALSGLRQRDRPLHALWPSRGGARSWARPASTIRSTARAGRCPARGGPARRITGRSAGSSWSWAWPTPRPTRFPQAASELTKVAAGRRHVRSSADVRGPLGAGQAGVRAGQVRRGDHVLPRGDDQRRLLRPLRRDGRGLPPRRRGPHASAGKKGVYPPLAPAAAVCQEACRFVHASILASLADSYCTAGDLPAAATAVGQARDSHEPPRHAAGRDRRRLNYQAARVALQTATCEAGGAGAGRRPDLSESGSSKRLFQIGLADSAVHARAR